MRSRASVPVSIALCLAGCAHRPAALAPAALGAGPLPACIAIAIDSTAHGRPPGQLLVQLLAPATDTAPGGDYSAKVLASPPAFDSDFVTRRARALRLSAATATLQAACARGDCHDTTGVGATIPASVPPLGAATHYSPRWARWQPMAGSAGVMLRWGAGTHLEFLTIQEEHGALRGETMLLGWPYNLTRHSGPDWAPLTATVVPCPGK